LLMMPHKRSIKELKALHIRQNFSKKWQLQYLGSVHVGAIVDHRYLS